MERLFDLGQVVATKGAVETINSEDMLAGLGRHVTGDWGELQDDDREANETGLRDGQRILSVYIDRFGTRYWIITEWDRSATTILLPENY